MSPNFQKRREKGKIEPFTHYHLVWEVMSKLETEVERQLTILQLWIMDMSGQVIN